MRSMTLRMSDELMARIDRVRAQVPRERFVRDVLVHFLAGTSAYDADYQRERPADVELLPEQAEYFKRTGQQV